MIGMLMSSLNLFFAFGDLPGLPPQNYNNYLEYLHFELSLIWSNIQSRCSSFDWLSNGLTIKVIKTNRSVSAVEFFVPRHVGKNGWIVRTNHLLEQLLGYGQQKTVCFCSDGCFTRCLPYQSKLAEVIARSVLTELFLSPIDQFGDDEVSFFDQVHLVSLVALANDRISCLDHDFSQVFSKHIN